jgi:GNAT superfamily N-acetyltransferase
VKKPVASPKTANSSAPAYRSATRPPRRRAPAKKGIAASEAASSVEVIAHDGRRLLLRPIQPDDAAALRRAFDRLTPEQIRSRFFFRMNELSEELAQRLCNVDAETSAAFVVTDAADVAPADVEIRAEARMHVDAVTQSGEFAIVVDPTFIGQGLGAVLLRCLLAECRRRGLLELWGDVLADNHAMLELVRHLEGEHSIGQGSEPGVSRVRLAVPRAAD